MKAEKIIELIRNYTADPNTTKYIGTNFDEHEIKAASFEGLRLCCCSFRFTNLHGTNFRDCDLRNSDFTGANARGCDFRGANIEGVIWDETDLRLAYFDTGQIHE